VGRLHGDRRGHVHGDSGHPDRQCLGERNPGRFVGEPRRSVLAACWKKTHGGTGSRGATIVRCTVIACIAGVLFFWRMLVRGDPLVDLRTFRNGNFSVGCLFSFVLGTGMYGTVYMIPRFLGRVRGYDGLQIGETMFVTGFGMFASAPLVGFLIKKVDVRGIILTVSC